VEGVDEYSSEGKGGVPSTFMSDLDNSIGPAHLVTTSAKGR